MGSFPNFSEIKELVAKGLTIEAQVKLMDFRALCLELREENLQLKERIKELETLLNHQASLQFDGGVYWIYNEGSKEGPFCATCHDKDDKKIRLQNDGPGWWCHVCRTHFGPREPLTCGTF